MRLFEQELATKLTANRLRKLLLLEKERRGITRSQLVFVGMANIAHYWWCAMQSVLKSVEMESEFFGTYLMDRLLYTRQLGHITALPRKTETWLDIGSQITFEEIEVLLREKTEIANKPREATAHVVAFETIDDDGNVIMLLNPKLSSKGKQYFEAEAQARGIRAVSWDNTSIPPKLRGEIHQMSKAEKYPTIRWNFPWHDYVVIGVPDGITGSFVYEFKSTRSRFFCDHYMKPVALTQADFYGYFFKRTHKKVQIHVMEEDKTETWSEPVSQERALQTLNNFERIDRGESAKPPRAFKCKSCEFTSSCPIYSK